MKKYKIDDKGRIRVSKDLLFLFKDNTKLTFDYNLKESIFLISNNYSKPHHH